MPKLDKTFSDSDIIRIFSEHLTQSEQSNVICFFKRVNDYLDNRKLKNFLDAVALFLSLTVDPLAIAARLAIMASLLEQIEDLDTPEQCQRRVSSKLKENPLLKGIF